MNIRRLHLALLITITTFLSNNLFATTAYIQNETANPWYLGVEYLLWKAQEDQLQYAVASSSGFDSGFTGANNMFIIDQCFKVGSGVRGTLGYSFCENWDVALAGTHFKKSSFGRAPSIPNGLVASFIFGFIDDFRASSASSCWNLALDGFDLEIARTQCIYDSFSLRLHMGVKGFNVKQTQIINYALNNAITANVIRTNNFFGIGPRMGFNTAWCIGHHINIIGSLSGALLYGKFKTNTRDTLSSPDFPTATPAFIFCKYRLRPTTQMFLGLNWEKDICATTLEINVGYEAQYWWNQWNGAGSVFSVILLSGQNGDLMTHGLTAGIGLHF